MTITKWTSQIEEELASFIKDWLKHLGKTQADLCQVLQAPNTRMSSLMEIFKRDFSIGGMAKIADRLCKAECTWLNDQHLEESIPSQSDPLGQLDLLLDKIKEDCEK